MPSIQFSKNGTVIGIRMLREILKPPMRQLKYLKSLNFADASPIPTGNRAPIQWEKKLRMERCSLSILQRELLFLWKVSPHPGKKSPSSAQLPSCRGFSWIQVRSENPSAQAAFPSSSAGQRIHVPAEYSESAYHVPGAG
jgi:hypothetical protein